MHKYPTVYFGLFTTCSHSDPMYLIRICSVLPGPESFLLSLILVFLDRMGASNLSALLAVVLVTRVLVRSASLAGVEKTLWREHGLEGRGASADDGPEINQNAPLEGSVESAYVCRRTMATMVAKVPMPKMPARAIFSWRGRRMPSRVLMGRAKMMTLVIMLTPDVAATAISLSWIHS